MHQSAEPLEKRIPEELCNMDASWMQIASRQSKQPTTGTPTFHGFGMAKTGQEMSLQTSGMALIMTVQPWEHLTW